jgi:FdhE protein
MTSTVAEHWCAGSTTRNIPWLNELVPEPVLEMPIALAQKLGVKSGDWVKVSSARGELTVKALVTPRMKELKIGDQAVGEVGAAAEAAREAPDLEPAGRWIISLVERLAAEPLAGGLTKEASTLEADLRCQADVLRRVVFWLLGDESIQPASPGLLRYVGWTVMARYLSPVVVAFARWRDEERWLRHYCPTCGSAPAMGQMVGLDPGRKRLLACGRCSTRWQYKRTSCPFCEGDSQRLATVAVEGEAGLRIDYCEACSGYLKTYSGQGDEALLLSDWSSLHLDLIARDRGLKRRAASLFDLQLASPEATASVESTGDS